MKLSLLLAWGLDQMIYKGPFQHKFCISIIMEMYLFYNSKTMKTNSSKWLMKCKKFSQDVSENTGTYHSYITAWNFFSVLPTLLLNNTLSSNSAISQTHSQMQNLATHRLINVCPTREHKNKYVFVGLYIKYLLIILLILLANNILVFSDFHLLITRFFLKS